VRPFLPPLLAGALARADAGLDFEHSDYEFLERPGFLLAVLALAVASYGAERSRANRARTQPGGQSASGEARPEAAAGSARPPGRDAVGLLTAVLALGLGALMFAGSLAAGDRAGWPGLVAGVACAAGAYVAVAALFARARRRLDASAAGLLPVYADGFALALSALAIFVPPVSYAALAAFAWLVLGARRAEGRKYAGLRLLR
jgi:hypothetical protein